MNNELLLLSGANIPFIEGTVTISQPTIYEISLIGEEVLFTGCELLKFSKDILNDEDKNRLINQSDFNILMSIMNDNSGPMIYNVSCAKQVLELIFPLYKLIFTSNAILLIDVNDQTTLCGQINENNFHAFKAIIIEMFCLKQTSSAQEYNVQGKLAKKIAEKFQRRKQKLAELAAEESKTTKVAIFSRYISILTVGQHKDMNSFMKYTVYQLLDEFQRFELKMHYDMYIKAKMAGAKDLTEPEDWRKDLHDGLNTNNKKEDTNL